jgi:hypothetical protein
VTLRTRIRVLGVVAVVLAGTILACGGSTATIGSGDGGGSTNTSSGGTGTGTDSGTTTPNDGGSPILDGAKDAKRDANPASCPATYMTPPGNCTVGTLCSYDQGRCECLGYCGGPPPPDDIDFSHWTCTPKLDNGCPEDRPLQGSTCKMPAASCSYGTCCVETFLCGESGKWSSGGISCPP